MSGNIDRAALERGEAALRALAKECAFPLRTFCSCSRHAFAHMPSPVRRRHYNPPWDVLKPDRRALSELSPTQRAEYISQLRAQSQQLAKRYENSQASARFSGWNQSLAYRLRAVTFASSKRYLWDCPSGCVTGRPSIWAMAGLAVRGVLGRRGGILRC